MSLFTTYLIVIGFFIGFILLWIPIGYSIVRNMLDSTLRPLGLVEGNYSLRLLFTNDVKIWLIVNYKEINDENEDRKDKYVTLIISNRLNKPIIIDKIVISYLPSTSPSTVRYRIVNEGIVMSPKSIIERRIIIRDDIYCILNCDVTICMGEGDERGCVTFSSTMKEVGR